MKKPNLKSLLHDLLNLLEKVKKSSIGDISEVVKLFNRLKTEIRLSLLLFSQLSDLVYYRSELETNGISTEHLKQILQMCKSLLAKTAPENGEGEERNTIQMQEDEKGEENYTIAKVLDSINTDGSMINLKNAVKNLEKQKDKLDKEISLSSSRSNKLKTKN